MRAVRSAVLILFAVVPPVLATACGGGEATTTVTPPPVSVASVSLSQSAATLTPPQTVALVATTKDASGNTLTGPTITWTSNAPAVATVDATGVVTAVAVGSAQITATVETKSASATITVNPGTFLGPSGGTATGFNGSATVTIPAGALGVGIVITIAQVANPQADPKLAAGTGYDFGPTGTVFALPVTLSIKYDPALLAGGTNQAQLRVHKLVGTTWTPLAGSTVNTSTHVVSGATSSFSTYAVLEVTVPVASVAITPSPVDLPKGMQVQLTATTKDAQGNLIPGRTVTWQSSVTNTAAISTTGLVTAGVIGATTITATSEGISSQMTLNVRSDPSARTLSVNLGSGSAYVPNRGIVVIAGTSDATCAIGSDQKGYCWGHIVGDGTFLDRAVPTAVALSAPLVDITVGGGFACALDTGNNAWCWGNNWYGGYGNGSFTSGGSTPVAAAGGRKFVDLSAGQSHVCGIGTDGYTYCWGRNDLGSLGIGFITTPNGPIGVPTPTRISGDPILVSLSVGNYGACGLTIAGAAYCWGSTGVHVSSPGPQLSATAVPGAPAFARISVGWDHVCGLTMDRKLYCWGQNDSGQLGDGTTADRPTPLLVGGGMSWRFVSAGSSYTCGITTDNRTFCWGLVAAGGIIGNGQVGSGTASGSLLPVQVSGGVPALAVVSAGRNHTCGLTVDGTGYCWGFRGELGDGDYSYSFRPTLVAGGAQNAQDVARGSPLGCYINTTKQLLCWGESEAETSAQVPSFGAVAVKSVVASYGFACVILDSNSHISCWGDNYLGDLGNGTTVPATAPTPIASAKAFSSVALAWYGGCGVSTAKELFCWGNGSLTPVQVLPGINWVSVGGGEAAYICAISDQAQAYCGPLPSSLTLIAGSQHWVMMATGQTSSRCGLTDTGDAYCMGDNSFGQLGDGTTTARAAMVPVSGGLKFTQIITAAATTCGMTAAGAAYCWGDGSGGQMGSAPGVPAFSGPFTPTLIPGGLHFTKLAGGIDGICGVTSDASVYCWGTRGNSSLGNGELDDRRTPVPVSGSMRFLLYEPGTAGLSARRAKQP